MEGTSAMQTFSLLFLNERHGWQAIH